MALSDTVTSKVLRLHQRLYEASDGRVGHRALGAPSLLLRTTGRRTGARRTNALIYAPDGDDLVVVASNGGADRPPAWLHNLVAEPAVEIQVGRDRRPARARVVERGGAGYERLWQLVNDNNRGRYDRYQTMTSRPIPIVVLAPPD